MKSTAKKKSHVKVTRKPKPTKKTRRHLWLACAGLIVFSVAWTISLESRTTNDALFGQSKPAKSSAVAGQISSLKHLASLSPTAIDNAAKVVYSDAGMTPAKVGIETYEFTYQSRDTRTGKLIPITGRAYIPDTGTNLTGFVFGPGTTGPGSLCAPSLEQSEVKNWGHYDNHLTFYAGQGYAVVMTDYDGRVGTDLIHHYFVGEMEAHAMLDAARALRNLRDPEHFATSPVGNRMIMSGYSQGGHAALWADHLRASYAPDITIAGIVSFAPATDLVKIFGDVFGSSTAIWLPPYLIAAYQDYYKTTTPAGVYLQEPYATTLDHDARSFCIDQLEVRTGRYGSPSNVSHVYQPAFIGSVKAGRLAIDYPELYGLLTKNLAGDWLVDAPVLTIAGDRDAVILPVAQTALTRRLCLAGAASVQLEMYPGITHYNAMSYGRKRALDWMAQVVRGETLNSDCGKYL